jgi:hypothetical protein
VKTTAESQHRAGGAPGCAPPHRTPSPPGSRAGSSAPDSLASSVCTQRIRQCPGIRMFLGLPDPDPDPLVRGTDPDPSLFLRMKIMCLWDPDPLVRGADTGIRIRTKMSWIPNTGIRGVNVKTAECIEWCRQVFLISRH